MVTGLVSQMWQVRFYFFFKWAQMLTPCCTPESLDILHNLFVIPVLLQSIQYFTTTKQIQWYEIHVFSYFPLTGCRPCDSGKFCAHENATTVSGVCRAGYFCRHSAESATPSASAHSGPCPEGHYCPAGTGEPEKCPRGTFSNVQLLENANECQRCTEGHYCGELGLRNVSGPCDPGFFCLKGSNIPNPSNVTATGGPCPIGHFCPAGTSYPLGCRPGTYNDRTGQSNCTACCAGYYCPSNSTSCVLECPEGHYCPIGTEAAFDNPCPKGYYNNKTRRQSLRYCCNKLFSLYPDSCFSSYLKIFS